MRIKKDQPLEKNVLFYFGMKNTIIFDLLYIVHKILNYIHFICVFFFYIMCIILRNLIKDRISANITSMSLSDLLSISLIK